MSFTRLVPYLAGHRFLYVGQTPDLPGVLRDAGSGCAYATTLQDLDPDVILRACPDVVLSPLLCESHDILDVARALNTLGYSGELIAIARSLPHYAMVQDEVREIWSAGNFTIIETDRLLH
ncbi:hypothetical protein [Paenirhodobacter populi]|uniref:Uncharacterized protein n=1 Tax=Paenirhodobacter populi TaxID=2306993 RepID=A0A443JVF4_9RHOB|nr:hypothetical protein [Sinirhodobacter populi]RWR24485.1 hypothetical protein D2T30_00835 [Sinirhodobacter populi]